LFRYAYRSTRPCGTEGEIPPTAKQLEVVEQDTPARRLDAEAAAALGLLIRDQLAPFQCSTKVLLLANFGPG
jgi:hypothetical protein